MNSLKMLCFSFLFIYALQSDAQYFYRQSLDSTKILIGDQLCLTLQSSNKPKEPDPVSELKKLKWFEIIDQGQWNLTPNQVYERKIKFSVFDSGVYTIPVFKVTLDSQNIETTPLTIKVDLPIDTTRSLLTIKDIIPTEIKTNYILYFIIACTVIGLLTILFYYLVRADRIKPKALQYVATSSPYEVALQKLNELENKKLWQSGSIKEYYDELVAILRFFLQDGFHIPAVEMTSTDIKHSIQDSKINWIKSDELFQCLHYSDLIKFANKHSEATDHLNWMTVARSFVSNNKDNSNQFLNDNKKDFVSILGVEYGSQFSRPNDVVPEDLLQLKTSDEFKTLILFSSLTRYHSFQLPVGWINLHHLRVGQLSQWHHNLIIGTPGARGIFLFALMFPIVAIFLPFLYIVGLFKQENIFSRGIFILDQNSKLLVDENKIRV